ncbi:MAG: response regulator transcription factor [Deltaproteobacteria bacterium]|nr:response regulator transcription factor [Deltaproteobacteria bacterium]
MTTKIRVLIADDHQIVRDGLRSLLENEPDLEIIATVGDGRATVKLVEELQPDVVIMDISMPGLNGIEATRKITRDFPNIKIIALSMHDDGRFVINMLKAGASGYLLKDCAFKELAKAIQVVVRAGKSYLSPDITDVVVASYVTGQSGPEPLIYTILTPREREVLQLVVEGKTSSQIAEILYISAKTVETHRTQLMHKLKISNIADLTKYAIKEGITSA